MPSAKSARAEELGFRLSPDLLLPPSAPTSTFAFLGTRRYGKSYAAGVLVEEFLDHDVQVVVIDPVGTWWGLRLAADGKSAGYPIPVFGGRHGDIPLESTGGELVAQLVAEGRRSLVLDVSEFSDPDQRRFVTAFANRLFALKKVHPSPLHLVFEEAHEFFPQYVDSAASGLIHATKRLWKMGGNYGIGGTLISQRAAEVNKGALNLTDRLFTTRLKAPEDVKRIDGWANAAGVDDAAIVELPTLPKHTIVAWDEDGAVKTVFRAKRTFDTGRTPEAGDQAQARALAPLNLGEIRQAMAATIEAAKESDPKALRAEIARLRAELNGRPAAPVLVNAAKAVEEERDRLRLTLAAYGGVTPAEVRVLQEREIAFLGVVSAVAEYQRLHPHQPLSEPGRTSNGTSPRAPRDFPTNPDGHKSFRVTMPPQSEQEPSSDAAGAGALVSEARRMLRVLATHAAGLTTKQLAILSGYAPGGSSYRKGIGRCRTDGLVVEPGGGLIAISPAGAAIVGDYPPLPEGRALLEYWIRQVPSEARRMLQALARAPGGLTTTDLAIECNYQPGGSSYRKGIGRVRALELVRDLDGRILLTGELCGR